MRGFPKTHTQKNPPDTPGGFFCVVTLKLFRGYEKQVETFIICLFEIVVAHGD